jgi:hypothetical protein
MYRKFLAAILAALGFSSCGNVHKCIYGPPVLYGGPPPDTVRSAEDIEELYGCPIEEYDDSLANDSTPESE